MIPRWALIGLGVAAVAGAAWYVAKRKQANDAQAKAERLASPAMIRALAASGAFRKISDPANFTYQSVKESVRKGPIGTRGDLATQLENRLNA